MASLPATPLGRTVLAGPKVVALGGGHGLAASLAGLRSHVGRLTAVVTVADDGGSSGRLRRQYGVLPPGDLRMALAALCGDDDWGRTWADVLQHRFGGNGELSGHAAGNLLIVALWDLLGEHVAGLDWVGRLLGAQGRVLPMSLAPIEIQALVGEPRIVPGQERAIRTVAGQHAVATVDGDVVTVSIDPPDPPACPEVVEAIHDADWVVLGPGSWFTSVIPHLLVPDIREALMTTTAMRAVTLNLTPEGGETRGFTPEMHLEVLGAYAPDLSLNVVIADRASVPDVPLLTRVAADMGATLVMSDVASPRPGQHDSELLGLAYARTFGRGRIASWR